MYVFYIGFTFLKLMYLYINLFIQNKVKKDGYLNLSSNKCKLSFNKVSVIYIQFFITSIYINIGQEPMSQNL